MIFRCRMYRVAPGKLEGFNTFFLQHLLPVQQRHGATLIGRWQAEEGVLLAVWAYESLEAYQDIQAHVAADPDSVAAQVYRRDNLDPLFTEVNEWMMTTTVPLEQTALAGLDRGGKAH